MGRRHIRPLRGFLVSASVNANLRSRFCLQGMRHGSGLREGYARFGSASSSLREGCAGTPIADDRVMRMPLQVVFLRLPRSPALEARIRRAVHDLERFFDGIVSCRVSVEAPHRHHHQGLLYRVVVEIGVPGTRIVVGRSPDEHTTHVAAQVAVRDAFRAARRRLEDYARRTRGAVKAHAIPLHQRTVGGV